MSRHDEDAYAEELETWLRVKRVDSEWFRNSIRIRALRLQAEGRHHLELVVDNNPKFEG
jgi:hypothetical protein